MRTICGNTSAETRGHLPCERSWRPSVNLFKRSDHPYWWYDFTVRGERFRGSTKETRKLAAFGKAATLLAAIAEGKSQTNKKAPVLSAFVVRFMSYVDNAKLADKSKSYLRNGWRLLEQTSIVGMRMDRITAEDVDAVPLPGGPYNINCALKTLRRMFHKAEEWGVIEKVPKLKLEQGTRPDAKVGPRGGAQVVGGRRQPTGEGYMDAQDACHVPRRYCSRSGYGDA